MGYTDIGLEGINKLIRGDTSSTPTYLSFATGSDIFIGTITSMTNEIIRKAVNWEANGIQSRFTVELSTLEANGSYIYSIGLTDDDTIGSGTIWTYDNSYIGSKNDSFAVQLEGETYLRRPII